MRGFQHHLSVPPLPLIRSYRIRVLFFRFAVTPVARTPGAPPTLLRGKLAGLSPGHAAQHAQQRQERQVRTRFYGNGYGIGNVMLETTCHSCLRSAQALLGELTVLPISLRRVQKEGKSDGRNERRRDSDGTGGQKEGEAGRERRR